MKKTKSITARIASALIALALILTCVPQATAYARTRNNIDVSMYRWYKPGEVSGVKVEKTAPRSLTVKFKKAKPKGYSVKGTFNYEIRVYKGSTLKAQTLTPKASTTVCGLKPGTKYTVKVRAVSFMARKPVYGKDAEITAVTAKAKKSHKHSYKTNYSYQPVKKAMDVCMDTGCVADHEYGAYRASKGKWDGTEWFWRTNGASCMVPMSKCGFCGFGKDPNPYITIDGEVFCVHHGKWSLDDYKDTYKKEYAKKKLWDYKEWKEWARGNGDWKKKTVTVGLKKAKDGMVCSCGAVK